MHILASISLISNGFPEKVGNFFNRIIEGPRICLWEHSHMTSDIWVGQDKNHAVI